MANKKSIRYQQIVKKMRNKTGLSTEKNQKIIDTFIELLTDTISEGNSVSVTNLGTFSYKTRENVVTRNVKTGDVYQPIDTAFATFSSAPSFKEKIKSKIDGRELVLESYGDHSEDVSKSTATKEAPTKSPQTVAKTKKSSSTTPKSKTSTTKKQGTTTKKATSTKSSTTKKTEAKKPTETKTTPTKRKMKRKSKLIV